MRRQEAPVDEEHWRATSPGIAQEGVISLRGLAPLVVAQVLLGLQMRTREGAKTKDDALRIVCDLLRQRQAVAIGDLPEHGLPKPQLNLLRMLRTYVHRALLDPETERSKTRWDTRAFGHAGTHW